MNLFGAIPIAFVNRQSLVAPVLHRNTLEFVADFLGRRDLDFLLQLLSFGLCGFLNLLVLLHHLL